MVKGSPDHKGPRLFPGVGGTSGGPRLNSHNFLGAGYKFGCGLIFVVHTVKLTKEEELLYLFGRLTWNCLVDLFLVPNPRDPITL